MRQTAIIFCADESTTNTAGTTTTTTFSLYAPHRQKRRNHLIIER